MYLRLNHLEKDLPEAALLEAERLLDAHAMRSLTEVEPKLWAARWDDADEGKVEVGVQLGRAAIKAATCECPTFSAADLCPHVAATALAIRRKMQEARVGKERPGKASSPSRKLTTTLVLQEVEPDELVEFVREYARRNRDFAVALKARFTTEVDAIAGKAKYHQLLDSALKLARRADRSFSHRGVDRLAHVLDELFQQCNQSLAQDHFLDASALLQAVVEKIGPILGKVPPDDDRLRQKVGEAIDRLNHLQGSAPPDLLQALQAFAEEQHGRALYRRHNLDLRFWPLLAGPFPDKDRLNTLTDLLVEQKHRYESEGRPPGPLLLAFFQLLRALNHRQAALNFVLDHASNQALIAKALGRASQEKDHAAAQAIIKAAMQQAGDDVDQHRALSDLLVPLSRQLGALPAMVPLLREALLQTLDPGLIAPLQRASGQMWKRVAKDLATRLLQSDHPRAKEILARLYLAREDTPALLDLIEHEDDLELLLAFDHALWPQHRPRVIAIYRRLLAHYAGQHLGPKSSAKIRLVLEHLKKLGENSLSRELAEGFRADYPERHTLMEQLAHFS